MEVEIELNLALTTDLARKVQEILVGKFELISFKTAEHFSLRTIGVMDANLTIDQAIENYLEAIQPIDSTLQQLRGALRVGVYFTADEAAAFCVELSSATVLKLANLKLAIEVTCYPCS